MSSGIYRYHLKSIILPRGAVPAQAYYLKQAHIRILQSGYIGVYIVVSKMQKGNIWAKK
jgi:hypothetical protein